MSTNNKLLCTKDYGMFVGHELNRQLAEKPKLEESMRLHGFMPSSPLHCIPAPNGKVKVVRGHHRLHYAKKLNLSVYYIIDETNVDLYTLEGDPRGVWSCLDFVYSYAKAGNHEYRFLLNFMKAHNLKLGPAAALVFGESVVSNNGMKSIKDGTFRKGDQTHAILIVELIRICADQCGDFCRCSAFVKALSSVARIPEIDMDRFKKKLASFASSVLRRRARYEDYMADLEGVYNRASRAQFPLSIRAKEVLRQRKQTFGRKS